MMNTATPAPKADMGRPQPRIDARLKVTGAARYPSDVDVSNPAYAFLVTSAIAKGAIRSFDLAAARAVAGVLDILTHENMKGMVRSASFFKQGGYASTTIRPLESREIFHDGQIIAVVLADSYEAAREAAYKVRVDYEVGAASASFDSSGTTTEPVAQRSSEHHDPKVGDAESAFRSAEVKLEAQYATPTQHHNPIELFSTTCVWSPPQLTIYEPSQTVWGLKNGVAEQLGIDPAHIRVVSTFVGGAFGSKGSTTPRTALVALAARRLNRPVKLVATREQGFTIATYRAETRHKIKLGATSDGKLTALSHEAFELTSRPDAYFVAGTDATARLYACPNVATKVSIVHADRNTPGFMRSPPEVPYVYALESALDELADKLGIDPVELRRRNDTKTEPINGLPYTSRSLMQCYDEAARAFGWSQRNPRPGAMRDGDWLIGWGCATATYPTQVAPAAARVRLRPNGDVRVETAAHEIGTGAYTVIAQMASEKLGVDLNKVEVALGDSTLPPAPVAGGSNTTASVCSVVGQACEAIRKRLLTAIEPHTASSATATRSADYRLEQGRLLGPAGEGYELAELFARLGLGAIEEYCEFLPDSSRPDDIQKLYAGSTKITGGAKLKDRIQFAFGAEFVEVRVHALTREIRVPRIIGAFAAGKIMNPRTARSQLMGGMIWGIGSALHEQTELDERTARYVNSNLADYLIAVNADVPTVEVILVPEHDDRVNPAGIKGLGELGNVGTAAAIANAVYHATGKRIRNLPIRIDDLIA